MKLNNNLSFDNGINGLVVHRTTNDAVTVHVKENEVFDNGRTSRHPEGRQDAGGLAVNSGGNKITAKLILMDNKVQTEANDTTYQCFGTCKLIGESGNNLYCTGKLSNEFDAADFTTNGCGTATE